MGKTTPHDSKARMRGLEVDREGITSLAAWLSLDPDKESLIYRRFDYLSARRTLHLQNKLIELEDKLEDLDTVTREGGVEAKKSLRKHELFEERARAKDSTDEKRMELLDNINETLNMYHEALLVQANIANLKPPRPRAIKAYRSYFQGTGLDDRLVYGKAQSMLDDEQDLVALHSPAGVDLLSTFLQDHWPQTFAKQRVHMGETTGRFQERRVQTIVALINILVASFLIIGAVVSLYNCG